MARTLEKSKGRSSRVRGFSMLIHDYFQSAEYAELSARAVKALIDLYCQYRGNNNGDFCAARKIMLPLGWKSQGQLYKALDELLVKGWIIKTRQGGRRVANLFAVSFLGIDACGGKLDVAPNPAPLHRWKRENRGSVVDKPRAGRKVTMKRVDHRAVQLGPSCGPMGRTTNVH